MIAETPGKKKHWWNSENSAEEHDDEHVQKGVTVKKEVKHLRRITKRGEMAVDHMSETLAKDKANAKELAIIKEVIEGSCESPPAPEPKAAVPAAPKVATFCCFECGANIPVGSERCPKCEVLYIADPKHEAIDEPALEKLVSQQEREWEVMASESSTAFVHLDIKSGEVICLGVEKGEEDFGNECRNCGAVTTFGSETCPLCHHRFDEWDTGLVGLLEGLKFDLDEDKELGCPACGEHVVIENGRCPKCGEPLVYRVKNSPDAIVIPVLREKDVIFVHIDVPNADISFASKVKFKKKAAVAVHAESIHLDSIDKGGFDQQWKGLSRI